MKTTFFILNSLIFLVLLSCSSPDKEANAAKETKAIQQLKLSPKQRQSLGLELGALEQINMGLSVFANGVIDVPPQNKSYIAMPFGGYIKKINVLDGMQVQKGQIMMVVEHPEVVQLQQEYLEALGHMEYLSADYERQKELYEKEAGSAKNYQQAKSTYMVTKAKLNGLAMKLEMANVNMNTLRSGQIERTQNIRSPFAGVITKVTANVGSFA